MKTRLASTLIGCCWILGFSALAADQTPSLEPLQGKWSVNKTDAQGRAYSQVIQIKKDQLTFQMFDAEQQLRLFAQGTLKAERAGPFNLLFLSDIRAGRSPEQLEYVEGSRAAVYALRDGTLYLASNFDRARDNEKPSTDAYVRKAAGPESVGAASAAESKLLGAWKMEVVMGDTTYDYQLRIGKKGGLLAGTLVSPRSGEHPCKSVQLKDNAVVIEVERNFEGNQFTFVYRGQLTGEGLSGNYTIKGQEDQFSGRWKASK